MSKDEDLLVISPIDYMKDINVNYVIRRKSVISRLEFKPGKLQIMGKSMSLESMIMNSVPTHQLLENPWKRHSVVNKKRWNSSHAHYIFLFEDQHQNINHILET